MHTATLLHKIDTLTNDFPGVQMYLKDESEHPFGTIKDRRNESIIMEAQRLGVDKLTLITSGNNGYSLAMLAKDTDIEVTCIVSKSINSEVFSKLEKVAHDVIKVNLKDKILRPEEIISFARERDDEVIWDVTNGYEESYGGIVSEIYSQLKKVDYIVVPLGSGGIFVGIAEQLAVSFHRAKVVGMGPKATHDSFADKLSTPWSPYTKAIQNYKKTGHKTFRLSESEIRKSYADYRNICNCEPSASIVFGALNHLKLKKGDVVVFVNSGSSL
ncbi:MAG: PLP-dependent lyase/thiolase [Candidatus Pacebacteria bacterium]|nr:PLP-dependent lyase/thiolase [Candidatus Paceibacterota bacterium]